MSRTRDTSHPAEAEARRAEADAAPEALAPSASSRPLARAVIDAVHVVERRICGDDLVEETAVAEGLALAGRRAARKIDAGTAAGPPASRSDPAGAWVDHRLLSDARVDGCAGYAFELVASTPQEAVDHCLAAHRIAATLGRPGLCRIDADLAAALALVALPDRAAIEALPSRSSPGAADAGPVALRALEETARLLGRPLAPWTAAIPEGARFVVVADGTRGVRLRRLAATFGSSFGALAPSLVWPLPSRELAQLLQRVEGVAVLAPDAHGVALADRMRVALAGTGVRVHSVPASVEDAAALAWALEGCFGVKPAVAPPGLAAEPAATETVVVGGVPGDAWTERLLLDAISWLGLLGPVDVRRTAWHGAGVVSLAVGRGPLACDAGRDGLDVLFAGHPDALGVEGVLDVVRRHGTVLVCGSAGGDDAVRALGPAALDAIRDRGIRLRTVSGSAFDRELYQGAILAAAPRLLHVAGGGDRALDALAARAAHEAGAGRMIEGLRTAVDREIPAASPVGEREVPVVPRLAATVVPDEGWRSRLHEFHLTGKGVPSDREPLPALPLRPALATALAATDDAVSEFPLLLVSGPDGVRGIRPLAVCIREALERKAASAESAALLGEHVERLCDLAAGALARGENPRPVSDTLAEAAGALVRTADPVAAEQLAAEIDSLRAEFGSDGMVLGASEHAPFHVWAGLALGRRRRLRAALLDEIATLVDRLRAVLRVDAGSDGAASATSYGTVGAAFLDPERLAGYLPKSGRSGGLSAERRLRIGRTVEVLERYRTDAGERPEAVVVSPPVLGAPGETGYRLRFLTRDDALRTAIGVFDGVARETVTVLRAVRLARLEAADALDEAIHLPSLARLDWQGLSDKELDLVPPVVVRETPRRLRAASLAAFSELLRSGRPIQVVVAQATAEIAPEETWSEMAGYHPGLGYLAVAHREAFVLQSNLGRPEHWVADMDLLTRSVGPAVALIAVPDAASPVPARLQLAAVLHGRARPAFLHDPSGGETWADRFRLGGNPAVDRLWPELERRYTDAGGEERCVAERFTFAHAAALDPTYRAHFRVVGPDAWLDDQMEIAEWIDAPDRARRRAVPFLWVVDDRGELLRAVTTRELAFACRDRARAWRILQELGGTDNEYARRAADEARRAAEDTADRAIEHLRAEHERALASARTEGVAEAVDRIVRGLVGSEATGLAPVVPSAPAPPVAEAPAKAAVASDKPYIDSFLCTTCNDCINLNPQMFRYNADKQATIADPNAGTYEQLVRAAEACPARCIHPGAPRPGDKTATEKARARGAKFS